MAEILKKGVVRSWTTPLLENGICFLLGLGGEHAARHLGGRLNTSHGEHGRSDIGKTAVLDTGELCLLINDDERHTVGGVSRKRMLGTVGSNVKHVIGVAVVGGNQRKAALGENRRDNLGQGIVNSLDSLNGETSKTPV